VRAKALGFAAVVALAALLPLYGDLAPADAVSHPEWARLILRGLAILSDEPGVNDTATQAFATLSGRDSRSFSGDRYVRGTRVETVDESAIRAIGGIGEAVYPLGVAQPGDYRLRLQLAGGAPAEAEIKKIGDAAPLRSFPVPSAPEKSWVDAGVVHLDPGAYDASVLLPEGSTLDYVELAPPCLNPIEPRGGWKADAIATTADVAVTVLQALDVESELPPADTPVELTGGALRTESGTPEEAASARFSGGSNGMRAVLEVDLPEDGLYTLSVFGDDRGGQRWLADGCRKSLVCPAPDSAPGWRTILSGLFQKGPHVFDVVVGPGTIIDRIRIEHKKDSPADYVATLARLGLQLGPEGPVTRAKADEARRFLERQRLQRERQLCGDILAPGTLIAELAAGGQAGGAEGGGPGGGGPGGGGPGGGGGGNVVPPPIIPPLPPASPTMPTAFGGGS
jgi:hypothetical protein